MPHGTPSIRNRSTPWQSALGLALVAASGALSGCTQDSYASTPERDTYMGDVRAVPEPSSTSPTQGEPVTPAAAASVSTPQATASVQSPGSAGVQPFPTGALQDAGSTSRPAPPPAGSAKAPRPRSAAAPATAPGKAPQ